MAWFDSQGNYYEGDRANLSDRGVPQRPSPIHIWVDGEWIEDAVKVAEIQMEEARVRAKALSITDNLPSRAQVRAAINNISNLADSKAFLLRLTDVVYWLAKDKAD